MSDDKGKPEDVVAFRADEPEGTDEPRGTGFALNVQGSMLAASAQGPGAQSHGTVINNYGPSKSDIRNITQEVVLALREAVGQAQDRNTDDMLRVSFAVARGLVAAKLGAEPDDTRVAEFLRAAVEDPAFPARAARLFQEGAKTPSNARRRLLASVLFGISSSTPERDRVDAAVERLFPEDVLLLQGLMRLIEHSMESHVFVIKPSGGGPSYAVLPGDEETKTLDTVEHLLFPELPLYSLQTVGCVEFGPWLDRFGPACADAGTGLSILPLGRAVLTALENAGLSHAAREGGE
jgi:hypothetical protein